MIVRTINKRIIEHTFPGLSRKVPGEELDYEEENLFKCSLGNENNVYHKRKTAINEYKCLGNGGDLFLLTLIYFQPKQAIMKRCRRK